MAQCILDWGRCRIIVCHDPDPRLPSGNCWPFISRPGSIARWRRSDRPACRPRHRPRSPPPAKSCRQEPRAKFRPAIPAAPPRADICAERRTQPLSSAREAARTAPSLEVLKTAGNFDGCELKFTAKRLVFSDGNPQARIMFVGEAPGRDEDIEGLPFVGRSGKLLDRMIAAIGLDRTSAYIANVIPWRPPGNRTPTPQETQICLPFIQRQIELVDPDVLVTLGNPSTQTLLQTREGIMKTRGHWFDYDTGTARSAPSPPSIRPICCARRPTSGCPGRICARSRRRWQNSAQQMPP